MQLKEVAPISSKDQNRRFWKYDIKVARDYNRTLENDEAKNIHNLFKAQFEQRNNLDSIHDIENFDEYADHLYQSTEVQRHLDVINVQRNQYTWSPSTYAPKRPSIKELKKFYFSLGDKKTKTKKQLKFKSQVVDCSTNNLSEEEENRNGILPCIPESLSSEALISDNSTSKKNKKFVVTPAVLE